MGLENITAAAAVKAIRSKEISARELTAVFLSRCFTANAALNSFIHIFEEEALKQADAVDEKIKIGEAPPLAGVPAALKDNLCYCEAPTTCGASALRHFRPPYNANVVQKLINAGAVIVGKANLDEFGLGSDTRSSFIGPTANPWDMGKVPTEGAAAAVVTGQCLLALSSDTGGSLRAGASRCGLFGLRPSTGLVSRHGLITFAPSFTQVGIIARDAEDVGLALKEIAGHDLLDSATVSLEENCSGAESVISLKGLKIGFPPTVFDLADDETLKILNVFRARMKSAGALFVEVPLPLFEEALLAYHVIAAAEASSNLSRFDGIRFGEPEAGDNLEQWYLQTRAKTFGAEGKRRNIFGTHILSEGSFEKYYRQAQKVWNLVRRAFYDALEKCDLIVLPAAAPAGAVAEHRDFLKAYRDDLFYAPVSLSGLPALSVPVGEAGGMPLGLQLVGKPFSESILAVAAARTAEPFKLPPAGAL